MTERFLTFQIIVDARFGPATRNECEAIAARYVDAVTSVGMAISLSSPRPVEFLGETSQWRIRAHVPISRRGDKQRVMAACNAVRAVPYDTVRGPIWPS